MREPEENNEANYGLIWKEVNKGERRATAKAPGGSLLGVFKECKKAIAEQPGRETGPGVASLTGGQKTQNFISRKDILEFHLKEYKS